MKKLFIFATAITIGLSGMAQDKHKGKGHDKDKSEKSSKQKSHDGDDDDDDNNAKTGKSNRNDDVQRRNNSAKYSKNLPSKVRAAFNRDYPNAANVTWTKNNGYWTASFRRGLLKTTATYAANGQRINGATAQTTRSSTTADGGSIWERLLTKQ